jgi:hypothetical protein
MPSDTTRTRGRAMHRKKSLNSPQNSTSKQSRVKRLRPQIEVKYRGARISRARRNLRHDLEAHETRSLICMRISGLPRSKTSREMLQWLREPPAHNARRSGLARSAVMARKPAPSASGFETWNSNHPRPHSQSTASKNEERSHPQPGGGGIKVLLFYFSLVGLLQTKDFAETAPGGLSKIMDEWVC